MGWSSSVGQWVSVGLSSQINRLSSPAHSQPEDVLIDSGLHLSAGSYGERVRAGGGRDRER